MESVNDRIGMTYSGMGTDFRYVYRVSDNYLNGFCVLLALLCFPCSHCYSGCCVSVQSFEMIMTVASRIISLGKTCTDNYNIMVLDEFNVLQKLARQLCTK